TMHQVRLRCVLVCRGTSSGLQSGWGPERNVAPVGWRARRGPWENSAVRSFFHWYRGVYSVTVAQLQAPLILLEGMGPVRLEQKRQVSNSPLRLAREKCPRRRKSSVLSMDH